MLDDFFKYAAAINAKGEPFLTEPLLIIKISEYNNWIVEKSIDM